MVNCLLCKKALQEKTIYRDWRDHFLVRTTRREVEYHHITPRRFGGQDATQNLAPLCRKCHRRAHKTYNDKALEFVLSRYPDFFEGCFEGLVNAEP